MDSVLNECGEGFGRPRLERPWGLGLLALKGRVPCATAFCLFCKEQLSKGWYLQFKQIGKNNQEIRPMVANLQIENT